MRINKAPEDLKKTKKGENKDKSFGGWLRKGRHHSGEELEHVAKKLKINPDYLRALEEENWISLPPYVYVKGFSRTYIHYLDLSVEEGMKRLEHSFLKEKAMSCLTPKSTSLPLRLPAGVITVTLLFLVFSALLVWYFFYRETSGSLLNQAFAHNRISSTSKRILSSEQVLSSYQSKPFPPKPASEPYQVKSPLSSTSLPLETKGNGLVLRARVKAHLEVKNTEGDIIVKRNFKPQEPFHPAGQGNLILSTDNGGAFEVFIDGHSQGRLGHAGVPVTDLTVQQIIDKTQKYAYQ